MGSIKCIYIGSQIAPKSKKPEICVLNLGTLNDGFKTHY